MRFETSIYLLHLGAVHEERLTCNGQIISTQLHGTTIEALWASLSFTLLVALTQPLYTIFSDVIGRKLALYVAFTFFTLGSIVFAVAHSMSTVIIGRALQGLGGGGLDVLNEVILADITTLKERPLWVGLMAVPMAAGSIAGPLIGASFAQDVNWRWIGWINLPLVGVSAVLAVFFLRLKPIERPLRSKFLQMDFLGILLFITGGTAFAVPLSIGGAIYPWSSWKILLPLIVGGLLLVGLAIYEARPRNPIFPYRIFRSRTAKVTTFSAFMHGMITYPLLFYLPLLFQAVYLQTPVRAAVLILPLCCSVIGSSLIAGIVVGRTRQYRLQFWLAYILLTVALGLFTLWNGRTSVAERAGFQIIAGIGIGVLFTILPLMMQASVESADDQGLAVGIMVCFRLFGALIGLAVGSTAFNSAFAHSIADIGPLPAGVPLHQNSSQALAFIPSLRTLSLAPQIKQGILEVYSDAIKVIWHILVGFSGFGFLAALLVKELSLDNDDVGRQHMGRAKNES